MKPSQSTTITVQVCFSRQEWEAVKCYIKQARLNKSRAIRELVRCGLEAQQALAADLAKSKGV